MGVSLGRSPTGPTTPRCGSSPSVGLLAAVEEEIAGRGGPGTGNTVTTAKGGLPVANGPSSLWGKGQTTGENHRKPDPALRHPSPSTISWDTPQARSLARGRRQKRGCFLADARPPKQKKGASAAVAAVLLLEPMGTRFALVGDIHGRFGMLADALDEARRRWGRFDFVLAVGDVEPNRGHEDHLGVVGPSRYRKIGDFPSVVTGDIDLGAPLYFIAGNHDPYPALDRTGPGEWAPDVWWLGRWGITRIGNINVAFVSGIYSPKYSDAPEPRRDNAKQRTYWHRSELEQLARAARRCHGGVDVLLTHDWPSDVGTNRAGFPVGDPSLRRLALDLRPSIHACGHMHHDHQAKIGPTRVVCLDKPRATHRGLYGVVVAERDRRGNLRTRT